MCRDQTLTVRGMAVACADESPQHVLGAIGRAYSSTTTTVLKFINVPVSDRQAIKEFRRTWAVAAMTAKQLHFHDCAPEFSDSIIGGFGGLHIVFSSRVRAPVPGGAHALQLGSAQSVVIVDGQQDVSSCAQLQRLCVAANDGVLAYASSLPLRADNLEVVRFVLNR